MESDFLDKLLIVLLITILPVSFFIASNAQKKYELEQKAQIEKEQMAKVTQTVEQLRARDAISMPEIEIDQVYYATESSKLVVTGRAPKKNTVVMVSTVFLQGLKDDKEASASVKTKSTPNVLGQAVDVVAIETDANGDFTFVKKVEEEQAGLVDVRFDQDKSSASVQYDINTQKQVF